MAGNIFRTVSACGIASLLLLGGCCGVNRCKTPPVVIDAHSHLFNARYLPLREIAVSRGAPDAVASGLEALLLAMTPESDSENKAVAKIGAPDIGNAIAIATLAKLPASKARDAVIQGFIAPKIFSINNSLSPNERIAIAEYIGRSALAPEDKGLPAAFTPEEIARALEKAGIFTDEHTSDAKNLGGLLGYLQFIAIVTSSEEASFEGIRKTYPQIELFVHHMMDLEKTYGEAPQYRFPEQVSKMIHLQNEFAGHLITFAAFDPFRRGDSLLVATNAYWAGAVGFKFYPPNGYRPTNNDIPLSTQKGTVLSQWKSRYEGISAGELDSWSEKFFQFCEDHDVPIFVHCTPMGFEAVKDYGLKMADPIYWTSVLQNHKKLRLCFGHAGGSGLWFGGGGNTNSARFGRTVAELCAQYDNVYCDAGYWEPILNEPGVASLAAELPKLVKQYPALAKKLMYGSDWFMISTQENYTDYLCQMAKALKVEQFQNDFFAGNAARFLNLKALADDTRIDPKVRAAIVRLNSRLTALEKSENRRK